MTKKILHTLLAVFALLAVSTHAADVNITAAITTNTNWTNNNTYILYGDIIVKNGATLNIQAGTIIKGDKATLSRLVIATGSKIIAQGTPTQPIVFTSNQPAGQRTRADWAGLAICGLAPVNFKDGGGNPIQGRVECGTTTDYDFGGSNPTDNSGILSYVRIEYAGYVCGTNSELNSLTLGGVGSGTQIDHVMVSFGQDDGFEFFGGTVNANHLVSYGSRDDDFDTDNGFSGQVQFGLVIRIDTIADQGDISNAFESDNDANGTYNYPYTGAAFSNITVVGPAATVASTIDSKYGWGLRLRRNTGLSVFNSVFIGYKRGLRIEGTSTQTKATTDTLEFKNNIIAGSKEQAFETSFDSAYLVNPATSNTVYGGNANDSLILYSPYGNPANFDFRLQAGSPALSGASFSNAKLAGLTTTTFRGAFDNTDNWTRCWGEFTPQDEDYASSPVNYGFTVAVQQTGNLPSASLEAVAAQGNTYLWSTGGTTQTISVTNSGTYTVTVTSARGCTATGNIIVQPSAPVNVVAPITTNTTWTNDKTYILYGDIIVKNNAVLTIQPGTLIKGDKSSLSRLVIATGSKLIAQGTEHQPIVFTSNMPAGQRTRADWAGIAICGLAPVNFQGGGGNPIQGRIECGSTSDYDFGGQIANDSSGVLSYVRIEYAGYVCGTNSELNSLTLGGVGNRTKIDHVMVSYGQDDGYEFFGGTANASHLISFGSRDDDFDTDNGYSGNVQFGLVVRVDSIADQGDISNAFESDNDANGSYNYPYTKGTFSNITVVGPAATTSSNIDGKYGWALRLRRNTGLNVFNSVFIGYKRGLRIEGSSTQTKATMDTLEFKNNVIAGSKEQAYETSFDSAYLANPATSNTVYGGDANSTVNLTSPYGNPDNYDFRPQTGSPVLSGASFSNAKLNGFSNTTYKGAFDNTSDWTTCWAEFSPQNEDYSGGPINYGFVVNVTQTGTVPSANLVANVPAGNNTFEWSTGATTSSITVTNAGVYTVTVTSERGCTAEGNLQVATDIEDLNSNIASISLFPNPTQTRATLQLSLNEAAAINIAVSDITGKVMSLEKLQLSSGLNQTEISTETYAAGIYLVHIWNGSENRTIRMIVNK